MSRDPVFRGSFCTGVASRPWVIPLSKGLTFPLFVNLEAQAAPYHQPTFTICLSFWRPKTIKNGSRVQEAPTGSFRISPFVNSAAHPRRVVTKGQNDCLNNNVREPWLGAPQTIHPIMIMLMRWWRRLLSFLGFRGIPFSGRICEPIDEQRNG